MLQAWKTKDSSHGYYSKIRVQVVSNASLFEIFISRYVHTVLLGASVSKKRILKV
jgi:hypothetical protein